MDARKRRVKAEPLSEAERALLEAARVAEAWWNAIPRAKFDARGVPIPNLDPKDVEREILAAIRSAPPDVNPFLCSFLRRAVEIARKGGEFVIGRAALREALVPWGKQGKRASRTPLVVFQSTAYTPADVTLLKRKGFSAPSAALSPEKRAALSVQIARTFGLTKADGHPKPDALRLARARGRDAVRALPDAPPTR